LPDVNTLVLGFSHEMKRLCQWLQVVSLGATGVEDMLATSAYSISGNAQDAVTF
jgi:hypothetical protein